jgi:ElaB/YqjD/DUF883 family membrane-anchored ribosome-binding protein
MRTKSENGHGIGMEKFLDDLKAVVNDGQELLRAGVGTAREKAAEGARTTDSTVREYPYQTLGIVFGLGLVLGVVATTMFSRNSDEYENY